MTSAAIQPGEAINLSGRRAPGFDASVRRQDDFARILGKARSIASGDAGDADQARTAAEEFVAMSLVQPMLAQLRASNHAAAPFAPTSGETQFQQMLDAHLAQNIVHARQFPLVECVARKLLKQNTGGAAPATHAAPRQAPPPGDATGPAVRPTADSIEAAGAPLREPHL